METIKCYILVVSFLSSLITIIWKYKKLDGDIKIRVKLRKIEDRISSKFIILCF